MPKQQFTTKQINRTQTNPPKQGCNLQKFARKHKQKLWDKPQKLNRIKAPTQLLMWADSSENDPSTIIESFSHMYRNSSLNYTVSLRHNLGSNVVFADGSVLWYKRTQISQPSYDSTIARKYWGQLEAD